MFRNGDTVTGYEAFNVTYRDGPNPDNPTEPIGLQYGDEWPFKYVQIPGWGNIGPFKGEAAAIAGTEKFFIDRYGSAYPAPGTPAKASGTVTIDGTKANWYGPPPPTSDESSEVAKSFKAASDGVAAVNPQTNVPPVPASVASAGQSVTPGGSPTFTSGAVIDEGVIPFKGPSPILLAPTLPETMKAAAQPTIDAQRAAFVEAQNAELKKWGIGFAIVVAVIIALAATGE